MPATKAIFFDIDGTLVSYQTHEIPPRTVEALKALSRRGILLFPASGRPLLSMRFLAERFPVDGWVSQNGQLCYAGGKRIHQRAFTASQAEALLAFIQETGHVCQILEEDFVYVTGLCDSLIAHRDLVQFRMPEIAPAERLLSHAMYQFVLYADEAGERRLAEMLPDVQTIRAAPMCLDAIPAGGGKPDGMRAMMQHFGIAREETMAFGDGMNDISMLRFAGTGIAMGDAEDAVKAAADYVTASVDADGIVSAIEHFSLL